jgi:hypothetical protein
MKNDFCIRKKTIKFVDVDIDEKKLNFDFDSFCDIEVAVFFNCMF